MVYEALLMTALILFAGAVFNGLHALFSTPDQDWRLIGWVRTAEQIYLLSILGLYCTWFWRRGQTLAMRAWKLRIVAVNGDAISGRQALARFVYTLVLLGGALAAGMWLREHPNSPIAWMLVIAGVASVAWTLFDPQRQALYDRLSDTRLICLS